MQVITPQLIQGKKVLLRLDLDLPIENGQIVDDFRLQAALPTLKLCLEHAESVIIMGHVGRPGGKEVPELSVGPIVDWLEEALEDFYFEEEKLHVLENLRFEDGEDQADLNFAKELASYGEIFINEAFAAHHPAASTTILPTLLPHAAGLRFAKEVEVLSQIKENPKRPQIAIIGGVKAEDKYPAILALSKFCDAVLVGGLLAQEIKEKGLYITSNVMLGKLSDDGLDLAPETIDAFKRVILNSKQVIWGGPVGKVESVGQWVSGSVGQNLGSAKGSFEIAQAIIQSGAESIVGGGDTVGFLDQAGLLEKFNFVSTGGGAMLKFLSEGSLPTIEVLS